MRINSINTALYTSKASSFGRTAHPYPEYENLPYSNHASSLDAVLSRVYALFTPEVTRKSEEIKSGINKMYENRSLHNLNGAPQQQLVSVFA